MISAVRTIAAVAAVAALPASAHAGPRADYSQVFTTAVPGASTGIDTRILYKHPDDPNAKPIPIRQEVFTFPLGTEFDESVVPDCTVPDLELQLQGESACPPETWVGSGHGNTTMTGFPGAGETAVTVNAFDYGRGVPRPRRTRAVPATVRGARPTRGARPHGRDPSHARRAA